MISHKGLSVGKANEKETPCTGGGGQPIHEGKEMAASRGNQLWKLDAKAPLRFSHENPDVQALYRQYLKAPLGEKSHRLLHVHHD